jgi:translation initiation factor 2B subunit (eIF-2B alpha/beta/delta family)
MADQTVIRDAVLTLSEKLSQRDCVLFVGDELSFSSQGESSDIKGLPTRSNMLERLRKSRSYITEKMSFSEALSMKESIEGRASILAFIREQLAPHLRSGPLPLHIEATRLPVSAIITTNWDSFLEQALTDTGVSYQVIIEDNDVPLYRSETLPLIKILGSLDRSRVIGTADEMQDLFRENTSALLSSFIRVICAQRTLLFLGYSTDDVDFMRFFRLLRRELGTHMPMSYIIQPNPNRLELDYWSKQQVHVIPAEPLDFLQRLNAQILLRSSTTVGDTSFDDSLWMENPFFRPLFQIRSLPTESQVVDGILTNILKILESSDELSDIGTRVISAIDQIADFRPNYAALAILSRDKIQYWFPPHTKTKDEVRSKIEKEIQERKQGKDLIGQRGSHLIEPKDKVLLYVQSTRVHAVVNSWLRKNPRRASELELIIPEARPKSPFPFQDAFETAHSIDNSDVQMTLVPDVSIAHLMSTGRITKIFFGAHKILENKNSVFTVTNVTGTLLIAVLASYYELPIYVFAEEDKVYPSTIVETHPSLVETTIMPEEQLIPRKTYVYEELLRNRRLSLFNPGYDDISSDKFAFTLITNKRELKLGPSKPD